MRGPITVDGPLAPGNEATVTPAAPDRKPLTYGGLRRHVATSERSPPVLA